MANTTSADHTESKAAAEKARNAVFAIAKSPNNNHQFAASVNTVVDNDEAVVVIDPSTIELIGSQWDSLERTMKTDKDLSDAISKMPSDTLVKVLNKATKYERTYSSLSEESSVPDAASASSVPPSSEESDNDQEGEEEESDDSFNSDSVSIPRISSSTIPLVMEVTRRENFGSHDPLFQGRCLYSGTMSQDQVKEYGTKHNVKTSSSLDDDNSNCKKQYEITTSSWFLPTVLSRYLFQVEQR